MDKESESRNLNSSSTDPQTSKITAVARVQRNVAEKLRRDKLNGYISELASIVPIISKAAKRMDKTSILRLSAAYLRISKSPLSGRKKLKSFNWCPNFLNPDQVRTILESVDGFLLVTETNGKILFTSRSVERYLGYQDIDMVGHTIFMFVHPEDVGLVKSELNQLLTAFSKKDLPDSVLRCSFHCRMKDKSQPRSEVQTYQFAHIMGALTLVEEEETPDNSLRRAIPTFKAFVRIVDPDPYNQLSLEEAIADEYVTRHSLDGTIIFTDHRISTITGHMPHEVTGFNAYKYIHTEDISVALFAHHLMFSNDKGTGMIVYRLRSRDDKYVYLKTVGCLQYDSYTSQVDHFVCVNQLLSESEGVAQLKYFTDHFIPHIKGSSVSSLFESVKSLQNSGSQASKSKKAVVDSDVTVSVNRNVKFKPGETSEQVLENVGKGVDEIGKQQPISVVNDERTLLVNCDGSVFTLTTSSVSEQTQGISFITSEANAVNTQRETNTFDSTNFNYQTLPLSSKSQSSDSDIFKTSTEITLPYATTSDFSQVNQNFVPTYLTLTPESNTIEVLQPQNFDGAGQSKFNNADSNDSGLLCGQVVSDFQDLRANTSTNFMGRSPISSESDPSALFMNVGTSSADNTQSSTLESDDSQTITLMSPMCQLKSDFNMSESAIRTDSPCSSTVDLSSSFRYKLDNSKGSVMFQFNSGSVQEDSLSSMLSTNENSNFYQGPDFLDSFDDNDLLTKEDGD